MRAPARFLLLASFCFFLIPLRAEDAKPRFQISISNLGVTGGTLDADAVVTHLNNAGWCTAAAAPPPARWNKRPENCPASEWVSVVLTGFGGQANAFVFMLDGPGNTPRLMAHIPYTISWLQNGAKKWIPPVDRITGAFRIGFRRPPPTPPAPVVHVKLDAWQSDDKETPGAAAPVASASNREALPPLEVMLYAAACAAGYAPTSESAEQSLHLDLRLEFKSASLRFSKLPKGGIPRQKEGLPEDHYYGYLVRLLHLMKSGSGIADMTALSGGHARLLAATTERLCATSDEGIFAFDPRSGKRLWASAPTTKPDLYLSQPAAARVFRVSRGLASIDLATGTQKNLFAESPGLPWSFSALDDRSAALARATSLSVTRNGKELWKKDESATITAGPLLAAAHVFAGTADGDIFCKNRDDGVELWRKNVPGECRGAIVDAGVAILSFIMGSNTLIAISAKEGSVLWKQPIGDVLLKIPERVGAQWLVASKNNRILLLNSADGSIAADVRWPTWLVDIAAATLDGKTIILCTDIRGQLSLLDAATLKTSRQFVLPSRPHGELFVVPQFSGKFGVARTDNAPLAGADDINALLPLDEIDGKRMPAVLVTDADGFCYIVPLK